MFVVALLALGVAMSVRRRREPMVIVAAARRRYEFLGYELLDRHEELLLRSPADRALHVDGDHRTRLQLSAGAVRDRHDGTIVTPLTSE
jgi:hypothetical protein